MDEGQKILLSLIILLILRFLINNQYKRIRSRKARKDLITKYNSINEILNNYRTANTEDIYMLNVNSKIQPLDKIMITNKGIFLFLYEEHRADYFGGRDSKKLQSEVTINGKKKESEIYNPIYIMNEIITELNNNISMKYFNPIVIFHKYAYYRCIDNSEQDSYKIKVVNENTLSREMNKYYKKDDILTDKDIIKYKMLLENKYNF